MRHNRITSLFYAAFASALTLVSCNKNEADRQENLIRQENKISICVTGDFNDLKDAEPESKATVKNIFRMEWAGEETVYVFGKAVGDSDISCLGSLSATVVEGTDNRVADLNGEISEPAPGTKLTLVYSPEFNTEPTLTGNTISIDLSSQSGGADAVTFVSYASVAYGGATSSTYRTAFNFATSILRVNIGALTPSVALAEATLGDIETVCKLEFFADEGPSVSGENSCILTRTFPSDHPVLANAKGSAAFYIALPSFSANQSRLLTITQENSPAAEYPGFATGSKAGGNLMNSIGTRNYYPVTGITLDESDLKIIPGDIVTLTATIVPEYAVNKSIVWTSTDTSVATVDANGKVTAAEEGTTSIIATTVDGRKTASCDIMVKASLFTVADDGKGNLKKVNFAPGNLYYDGTKWDFEKHQYDFRTYEGHECHISEGTGAITTTPTGNWGLFGWVGNSSTEFVDAPEKYGVSSSMTTEQYGLVAGEPLKSDWGTVIDDKDTWYTLTIEEWAYLFDAEKGRKDAGSKYGYATVDDVYGIILLPDGLFTDPKQNTSERSRDNMFIPGNVMAGLGWDANIYSAGGWEAMEFAGAVFLPAAGYRIATDFEAEIGDYWSSSSSGDDRNNAYCMSFGSIYVQSIGLKRHFGVSVRLATEVKY